MLHAIIMAGGSGTRFWPKSRRDRPKQLLRLAGESTMLQQTVARIEPLVPRDRILIVTGADQAEATRAQLPDLPAENVIAEPAPRDTAPCVGLAAGIVASEDPAGTMIVMPADHVIEPAEAFRRRSGPRSRSSTTIPARWSPSASSRRTPRPATATSSAARSWKPATESPSTASFSSAKSPTGPRPNGSWPPATSPGTRGSSSGEPQTILDELRAHRPKLAAGLEPILRALGTPDEAETLARLFPGSSASRSTRPSWNTRRNVRVLEVPYAGTTSATGAVASLLEHDAAGNAIQGHVSRATRPARSSISDDGGLVATLGVDDLVIVHSGKATLVAQGPA